MCKGRKPQPINIFSFIVEGLKPKLGDPNFIDFIQKYDVVIFTETWKADTSKINIEGHWVYSQIRPKHKNAINKTFRWNNSISQTHYQTWYKIS